MIVTELTLPERDAILAALHLLKRTLGSMPGDDLVYEIGTNGFTHPLISNEEIEALANRLNS